VERLHKCCELIICVHIHITVIIAVAIVTMASPATQQNLPANPAAVSTGSETSPPALPVVATTVTAPSLLNRTSQEVQDMLVFGYWTNAALGFERIQDLLVMEKLIKIIVRFIILGSIFYMLIAGFSRLRSIFSYGSKTLLKKQLTVTQ